MPSNYKYIPLSGQCESEVHPRFFYEYKVSYSETAMYSVHVKVELWLWSENYSNPDNRTRKIKHSCKVSSPSEEFGPLSADIDINIPKDYDGRKKLGPFVVFNQSVRTSITHTITSIVPVMYMEDGGESYVLNNRLGAPLKVSPPPLYNHPYPTEWVTLSPNPAELDSQGRIMLTATWAKAKNAAKYNLFFDISKTQPKEPVNMWALPDVSGQQTSVTFDAVWQTQGRAKPGDTFWFGVRTLNNMNVTTGEVTWSGAVTAGKKLPMAPTSVSVTPSKIDVAAQDSQSINATWNAGSEASEYIVYIAKGNTSNKKKVGKAAERKRTLLPKSYFSSTIVDGDKFYIGVASVDNTGDVSSIKWSSAVEYYDRLSYAPSSIKIVGRRKTVNDVYYKGETCEVTYSGMSNGSYPIVRFELHRDTGGILLTWQQVNATPKGGSTYSIKKGIPWISSPDSRERWELRTFDSRNKEVFMRNGGRLSFEVYYYGGIIFVRDSKAKWREGETYVYDSSAKKWKRADVVWIYTRNGWKSL